MVEETNHSPSSNQNTNIIVGYKEMPVVTGLGLPLMKGLSHILGGGRGTVETGY